MGFGGPNCTNVWAPLELSYISGSISVLLALITFPGNFLVCLAIVLDPCKELRTPFNYLLLSLATTDLIVGAFMDPLSAVFHYSEAKKLDLVARETLHLSFFIVTTASLLTLAALAIDRYTAVRFPYTYKAKLTSRRALVATVVIWTISVGISFIYFPLGYIFYSFVFANVAVFSTFIVLVFVYTSIYKKLSAQMKIFDKNEHPNDSKERKERRKAMKMMRRDRKTSQALVQVLLAFVICYTPACVMIYFLNMCSSCNCTLVHWFRDLQFVIILMNSAVNPYLYAFRLQQFRKAFQKLIRFPVSIQVSYIDSESKSFKSKAHNPSEEVLKLHKIDWLENSDKGEWDDMSCNSAKKQTPHRIRKEICARVHYSRPKTA